MKVLTAGSVILCVALGGCTGMRTQGSMTPHAGADATRMRVVDSNAADARYVAEVNRIALRRGVAVQWINAPRERGVEAR